MVIVFKTRKHYAAHLVLVLSIGALVGYGICKLNHSEPVQAQAPFDYSQCQYPDRTTNPVGGCDNSDPCDPANVKGGSGDCTPSAPLEKPTIISEPVVGPAPINNDCGGK